MNDSLPTSSTIATGTESGAAESLRQRELIAAIFSPNPVEVPSYGMAQTGCRWRAGLAAYRGNGIGHARSALREQFPTLLAMLGDDAFDTLCAYYWRSCPPRKGDLAWAGVELPDFIDTVPELQDWPWLSDCARLDWAVWQAAGAARSRLNEEDLRRLATGDPQSLYLQLAEGVRRIASYWPIVTLYQAHSDPNPDWNAVTRSLEYRQAETALAWRPPENSTSAPTVMALDEVTDRWVTALINATNIETALELAGNAFDFAAWLELAVRQGWLNAVIAKE